MFVFVYGLISSHKMRETRTKHFIGSESFLNSDYKTLIVKKIKYPNVRFVSYTGEETKLLIKYIQHIH